MVAQEKVILDLLERWFEDRTQLSKADFDMIKKFYWLVVNRGTKK